jgi:hypothetical protein
MDATDLRPGTLFRMATRKLTVWKHTSLRRYPLQLAFSYVARRRGRLIHSGWGETIEIGSSQIRVCPLDAATADATDIVMSIAWPAKLPNGTRLQLVIQTKPVGEDLIFPEFRILKHEFRTASREANGLGLKAGLQSWRDESRETTPRYAAASGI